MDCRRRDRLGADVARKDCRLAYDPYGPGEYPIIETIRRSSLGMIGAPGSHRRQVQARAPCRARIVFAYSRPWERGAPPPKVMSRSQHNECSIGCSRTEQNLKRGARRRPLLVTGSLCSYGRLQQNLPEAGIRPLTRSRRQRSTGATLDYRALLLLPARKLVAPFDCLKLDQMIKAGNLCACGRCLSSCRDDQSGAAARQWC